MKRYDSLRRAAAITTVVAVMVGLGVVPAAGQVTPRGIDLACPEGEIPPRGFADTQGNPHERPIDCAAFYGVTAGTSANTYSPHLAVRRDQMASFLARFLEVLGQELPQNPPHRFDDVDPGNVHALAINQLAALGVVAGVAEGTYGPALSVRRDQMASFLVRVYDVLIPEGLEATTDHFDDDDGNPHEDNVNSLAEVGVVAGVADRAYAPGLAVRRDQMASFLMRLADVLLERGGLFTSLQFAIVFWTNVVDDRELDPVFGAGERDVFGFLNMQIDSEAGRLCYTLEMSVDSDLTHAQLHQGTAEQNGLALLRLDAPVAGGSVARCLTDLDTDMLAALEADPAGHYVAVYSQAAPDGAARGQFGTSFHAVQLSWAAEVDDSGAAPVLGQGQAPAAGLATLQLDAVRDRLCAYTETNAEGPFTGYHLHEGVLGRNGPVVLGLDAPGEDGSVSTCVDAPAGLLSQVEAEPSGYYLNIHTADHPDGAVRGQLFTGVFAFPLTGEAVTGGAGEAGAEGFAHLLADFGAGRFCSFLQVDATPPYTSARIHRGAADATGPVVLTLATPGDDGTSSACGSEDADLLFELARNPADYYLEIRSASHPEGAVRGQLAGGGGGT